MFSIVKGAYVWQCAYQRYSGYSYWLLNCVAKWCCGVRTLVGVTDFCETGWHRDADDEGTVNFVVIKCLCKSMFVCKVFLLVIFFY